MARQICVFRQGGACHSLDDSRVTHRPGGLPSVTLAFLLSSRNASQYHYAKWEERSRGTAALMHRAAAQLDFARGRPLDVWVHVADAGWPELPLPINAAPRGVTLETVASSRAAAASLFPDYSLAGWEAIGYDHREHSLRSFVETLLLAGQRPTAAPLRPQAVFVGNELMHPVRTQLRSLAQQWPAWLDVRHVPPYDADGARQYSAEHVDFPRLAEWAILLDVPGGGWSGRLKFLPLMQRPLLVLDRAAWGWAEQGVESAVLVVPQLKKSASTAQTSVAAYGAAVRLPLLCLWPRRPTVPRSSPTLTTAPSEPPSRAAT